MFEHIWKGKERWRDEKYKELIQEDFDWIQEGIGLNEMSIIECDGLAE